MFKVILLLVSLIGGDPTQFSVAWRGGCAFNEGAVNLPCAEIRKEGDDRSYYAVFSAEGQLLGIVKEGADGVPQVVWEKDKGTFEPVKSKAQVAI